MSSFVPKGNTSLRVRGTASGSTSSYNGAPAAGGELYDTAQIGADSTDQSATAGQSGGADQIVSGYGYDVSWMLPLSGSSTIANTNAGTDHPSIQATSSNQSVSGTSGPTASPQAPARFYFSSEGADSSVSNVAVQAVLISVAPGTTTANGTVPFGGVGVASDGTLVSSNVGSVTGNGETTAPFVIASSGGNFGGTLGGTSGQAGIDVSTINVSTPYHSISEGSYNPKVSLLSQFMASTFVSGSAGYGYAVTAQTPANHSVFIAAAPPKA